MTIIVETENGLLDARLLRNGLGRFATGITVITTRTPQGKNEGLTANSFSAVSLDPPLVLWSLDRTAPSLDGFRESGSFAVNVLASHQRHIANHFAQSLPDKFSKIAWFAGLRGCPLLDDHLAAFECRTESTVKGGDHVIFIGRVERLRYGSGKPLIFSDGHYCVAAALRGDTGEEDGSIDLSNLL